MKSKNFLGVICMSWTNGVEIIFILIALNEFMEALDKLLVYFR